MVAASFTSTSLICIFPQTAILSAVQGYLAAGLQNEAVSRLKRQLAGCIEMLTKQLEQLDGLSLAGSTDELRNRRKTTVRRIQVYLTDVLLSLPGLLRIIGNCGSS